MVFDRNVLSYLIIYHLPCTSKLQWNWLQVKLELFFSVPQNKMMHLLVILISFYFAWCNNVQSSWNLSNGDATSQLINETLKSEWLLFQLVSRTSRFDKFHLQLVAAPNKRAQKVIPLLAFLFVFFFSLYRWFSRYVIAAMLVDEKKRFLISSFCSSTSNCTLQHCYLCP